jgi:hypothetical protein
LISRCTLPCLRADGLQAKVLVSSFWHLTISVQYFLGYFTVNLLLLGVEGDISSEGDCRSLCGYLDFEFLATGHVGLRLNFGASCHFMAHFGLFCTL